MRNILKRYLKRGLGPLLSLADVKLVNQHWGPRGFAASFNIMARFGMKPNVIFDIGAAKGTWTEETRAIFPHALYVLVDPLPKNRESLNAVAARSGKGHVISAAVGGSNKAMELYVHGDQSSFLKSQRFGGDSIKVPVRTCDDILDEVWPGDRQKLSVCLKVDAQGFEMEVLAGATRALENTDVLLIEVSIQRVYEGNPLAHQVIAHLGALGFCIYDIASYVQRPHDRALTQVDLVFVRENSSLMSYVGWH
jgi:FkbM family methyltransferase